VVQQCTGRVRRRVTAGDELGQGFSGEFFAAERLARFVAAFHEAGEQVDAFCVGLFETRGYAGDGYAGETLDCFDAAGEEGVRDVFCVGLELGEAADGSVGVLDGRF
jgi:hypothetical protein